SAGRSGCSDDLEDHQTHQRARAYPASQDFLCLATKKVRAGLPERAAHREHQYLILRETRIECGMEFVGWNRSPVPMFVEAVRHDQRERKDFATLPGRPPCDQECLLPYRHV